MDGLRQNECQRGGGHSRRSTWTNYTPAFCQGSFFFAAQAAQSGTLRSGFLRRPDACATGARRIQRSLRTHVRPPIMLLQPAWRFGVRGSLSRAARGMHSALTMKSSRRYAKVQICFRTEPNPLNAAARQRDPLGCITAVLGSRFGLRGERQRPSRNPETEDRNPKPL
jgi:hypothetical protein